MAKTWDEIRNQREKERNVGNVQPNWNDIKVSRGFQGPTTAEINQRNNDILTNYQNLPTRDLVSSRFDLSQYNLDPIDKTSRTIQMVDGVYESEKAKQSQRDFQEQQARWKEENKRTSPIGGEFLSSPNKDLKPTTGDRVSSALKGVGNVAHATALGIGESLLGPVNRLVRGDNGRDEYQRIIDYANQTGRKIPDAKSYLENPFTLEQYIRDESKIESTARNVGEIAGDIGKIIGVNIATGPLGSAIGGAGGVATQRAISGAVTGAEKAYSSDGDFSDVMKRALKNSVLFSASGAVGDLASSKVAQALQPVYNNYPEWGRLLRTAVRGSGAVADQAVETVGDIAFSKAYGEDVDIDSVIKQGLAFAGAEIIMSLLSKQPFASTQGETVKGPRVDFDESLTAESLRKKGYKEYREGSGIWLNPDNPADLIREMVNIDGNAVYKSDIWTAERSLGRKLTKKEILESVGDPNYLKSLRGSNVQTDIDTPRSGMSQDGTLLGGPVSEAIQDPVMTKPISNKIEKGNVINTKVHGLVEVENVDKNTVTIKTGDNSIKVGKNVLAKDMIITDRSEGIPEQAKTDIQTVMSAENKKLSDDVKRLVFEIEKTTYPVYTFEEVNAASNIDGSLNEMKSSLEKQLAELEPVPKVSEKATNQTHINERSFDDVKSRDVLPYQQVNPQVKPYIRDEANRLLNELSETIKGERFATENKDGDMVVTGTKRMASEPINRMLNIIKPTPKYKDIENALKRIVDGNGKENTVLAKKIELIIDDNLTNGTKDLLGYDVEPNQNYIQAKTTGREQQDLFSKGTTRPFMDDEESLTSTQYGPKLGPATGTTKKDYREVKRASEIAKDIQRDLNVALKKGGVKRGSVGTFNNQTHIVRISKANDLATLSHETGHLFDKLYDLSVSFGKSKEDIKDKEAVQMELMKLGRPTSPPDYPDWRVRREGVAEFVNKFLTQKDTVQNEYPAMYHHFINTIPGDAIKTIERIATDIDELVNLDPVSRVKKSISFKGDKTYKKPISLKDMARTVYTGLFNVDYPIMWSAGELGGKEFKEEITNRIVAMRGWQGQAMFDINPEGEKDFYQTNLAGQKVGPSYFDIVAKIHKDEETRRDFMAYSVARRNYDYAKQGLDMPDTPETYMEAIKTLEEKYKELDFPKLFEETLKYRDNSLNLLVEAEVYSDSAVDDIRKANPNYVSLKRVQEAFEYATGSGSKMAGAKKTIKKRSGGGEDIIDPEESDINNTYINRSVALRNKFLLQLVEVAEKAEGKGHIISNSPKRLKATQFNMKDVKKYLVDIFDEHEDIKKEYGSAKKFVDELDLDVMARLFSPNYLAGPNQIVVYKKGTPYLYDVHPELYEALSGTTPVIGGAIVDAMTKIANVQKQAIVFTPKFIAYNTARDTFHNLISTKAGINPFDVFLGFYDEISDNKWARIALRGGAKTNYYNASDRNFAQETIDSILENESKAREYDTKLKKYFATSKREGKRLLKSPLDFFADKTEPSEMGGRTAEMKKIITNYLKDAGYSQKDIDDMTDQDILDITPQKVIDKAVAGSRGLSVDFLQSGKWIRELRSNSYINFLNPQLQGGLNVTKLFIDDPVGTSMKGIIYITLPTLALYWLNSQNENYHELNNWQKDFFFNIPLGDPKTTKIFAPVPRPWELGLIFGALPERFIKSVTINDPKAWKDFDESMKDSIFPSLIPSAIEPIYRDATGRNWLGKSTLNYSDQRVSPELQYNDYTNELIKSISYGLKDVPGIPAFFKSPKRLQQVVEGYTGTWGKIGLGTINNIMKGEFNATGGISDAFLRDAYKNPQSIQDFYDYKNILDTKKADATKLGEEMNPKDEALQDSFYQGYQAISILDGVIKDLEKSKDPNKKEKIAEIKGHMIKLAKGLNLMYEEVERKYSEVNKTKDKK